MRYLCELPFRIMAALPWVLAAFFVVTVAFPIMCVALALEMAYGALYRRKV